MENLGSKPYSVMRILMVWADINMIFKIFMDIYPDYSMVNSVGVHILT